MGQNWIKFKHRGGKKTKNDDDENLPNEKQNAVKNPRQTRPTRAVEVNRANGHSPHGIFSEVAVIQPPELVGRGRHARAVTADAAALLLPLRVLFLLVAL